MENVITLGKLISLLFLFRPPLSILFLKTPKIQGMTSLALYNGNHFSSYKASEASPTLGCSIKISHDIYMFVPRHVICNLRDWSKMWVMVA